MREFVSSDITRGVMEHSRMIFGTIKESIMELLDELLGAFRYDMVAMVGADSLNF